ncbi:hypothetical protein [Bacillus massiliglaciei]|uniref:hypothetical protein n=1 Tax=Bacillus massiliglaciei TaxID=1816693 RepID=UPI0018FEBFEF|nr:hypothetical protein [Bacillus massiliglaciei]
MKESDRMERKYCLHCQTLQTNEQACDICGKRDLQTIIIRIQNQDSNMKEQ